MSEGVVAGFFVVWGFAVGGAYFALVMRSARQLARGNMRIAGVLGAFGLRIVLFVPGAVVGAWLSLAALGTYMVGIIAARFTLVYLMRPREAS